MAKTKLFVVLVACTCFVGAWSCDFTIDGQPFAPGEDLTTTLRKSARHTLHSIRATAAPCAGFLRSEPYYIRAGSTDAWILNAVNLQHEFEFVPAMLGTEPKTILDLGANCGLSVAYLAARFPQATVAAVEPSIHNYAVAGMNTYKQSNVHLLWGAAWATPSILQLAKHNRGGEWGYTMEELNSVDNIWAGTPIPGLTIDGIMQKMGWSTIDLAKIDIECGEFSLFNEKTDLNGWISKVKCMTMELHNFCKVPPESVTKVIREAGFTSRGRHGELDTWCRDSVALV